MDYSIYVTILAMFFTAMLFWLWSRRTDKVKQNEARTDMHKQEVIVQEEMSVVSDDSDDSSSEHVLEELPSWPAHNVVLFDLLAHDIFLHLLQDVFPRVLSLRECLATRLLSKRFLGAADSRSAVAAWCKNPRVLLWNLSLGRCVPDFSDVPSVESGAGMIKQYANVMVADFDITKNAQALLIWAAAARTCFCLATKDKGWSRDKVLPVVDDDDENDASWHPSDASEEEEDDEESLRVLNISEWLADREEGSEALLDQDPLCDGDISEYESLAQYQECARSSFKHSALLCWSDSVFMWFRSSYYEWEPAGPSLLLLEQLLLRCDNANVQCCVTKMTPVMVFIQHVVFVDSGPFYADFVLEVCQRMSDAKCDFSLRDCRGRSVLDILWDNNNVSSCVSLSTDCKLQIQSAMRLLRKCDAPVLRDVEGETFLCDSFVASPESRRERSGRYRARPEVQEGFTSCFHIFVFISLVSYLCFHIFDFTSCLHLVSHLCFLILFSWRRCAG
jgi:hypothetical protein